MKKLFTLILATAFFQNTSFAQWVSKSAGFSSPNALVFKMSVPSANVAWACAFDTASFVPIKQVAKTTDGGLTWSPKDLGIARTGQQITDVFALDANTAWVTAYDMLFEKGKIYKTTNGGTSWTAQTTAAFTENYPLNIFFTDANNGVAMADVMLNDSIFEIYTTTNGGTNWTQVPRTNLPALLPGKEINTGNAAMFGNKIWFGTDRGRIFHSSDKGLTWTAQTTGSSYIETITFKDANNGWILGDNGIEKTTDGGLTWTVVASTGPLHYGSICYIPGTANTLISTGDFEFDKGTSISTDGGLTWTDIETTMVHTVVKFTSLTNGYAGAAGNTMHKYTGMVSGISKEEMAREIKLYPNPSTGIVNLQTATFSAKNATVSVFNLTGKKVYEVAGTNVAPNRELKLDLTGVAEGAYIVKIQGEDQVLTRPLVLQK